MQLNYIEQSWRTISLAERTSCSIRNAASKKVVTKFVLLELVFTRQLVELPVAYSPSPPAIPITPRSKFGLERQVSTGSLGSEFQVLRLRDIRDESEGDESLTQEIE